MKIMTLTLALIALGVLASAPSYGASNFAGVGSEGPTALSSGGQTPWTRTNSPDRGSTVGAGLQRTADWCLGEYEACAAFDTQNVFCCEGFYCYADAEDLDDPGECRKD
jgi:hypothetical protein